MTDAIPTSGIPLQFTMAVGSAPPAVAISREGAGDFNLLMRSQLPAAPTAETSGIAAHVEGSSQATQSGEGAHYSDKADTGAEGGNGEPMPESQGIDHKDTSPSLSAEALNSLMNPIQAASPAWLAGYTLPSGMGPNITLTSAAQAVQSPPLDPLSTVSRKATEPLASRSVSRTTRPPSNLPHGQPNPHQDQPALIERFADAPLAQLGAQLGSRNDPSHSEPEPGDRGVISSPDLLLFVGQPNFTLGAKMAPPLAHEPGAMDMTAPPLLDLDGGDAWIEQLSNDIRQLSEKDGQLRFHLAPKNLGMLHVTIEREQATLRVQMLTETAIAHEKLSTSGAQIIADARANGVTISDVTISSARHDDMAQSHSPRGGAQPHMTPRHRPDHPSGQSDERRSRVEKSTSDRFA
ncbi:MAG: flagellar hook-length control protein FliK [Sphingopyxis sp.]